MAAVTERASGWQSVNTQDASGLPTSEHASYTLEYSQGG